MVFNNRIKEVQKLVYDGFNIVFNSIAKFLGYPKLHVGDDHKFVSVADAIRTACRKMLDQLDAIDERHGRAKGE